MFEPIYITFSKIKIFIGAWLTRWVRSTFRKPPKLMKKNRTFLNFRVTFLRSRNVTNRSFLALFSSKFNVDSNASIYFPLSQEEMGENGHFYNDVRNHRFGRIYTSSVRNVLMSPPWYFWNSFFGLILLLTGVWADIYNI